MQSRDAIEFDFFLKIYKDLPLDLIELIQNTVTWNEFESLEDEIYLRLSTDRDFTTATAEAALVVKVVKATPTLFQRAAPEVEALPKKAFRPWE